MKNTLKSSLALSLLAIAAVGAQPVWAHEWTARAQILSLEAGWSIESLSVRLNAPIQNPAGCGFVDGGYVVAPTDPGRKLFHDMLRDAYFNGRPISLLIRDDGVGPNNEVCPFTKPRIIDVLVQRNP